MKKNITTVGRYKEACENLVQDFVDTYYPNQDWSWPGDRPGISLWIGDNFGVCFSMETIFEALNAKVSKEQVYSYNDYCMAMNEGGEEEDRSLLQFVKYGSIPKEEMRDKMFPGTRGGRKIIDEAIKIFGLESVK